MCNAPIRNLKLLGKLLVTQRKRAPEVDCPKCDATLVIIETIKISSFYALSVILGSIPLFFLFSLHRFFFRDSWSMSLGYRLLFTIFLLSLLSLVAWISGIKLEVLPTPKKFYDPDRLN